MDLNTTPDEEAFRAEVAAFFDTKLPPEIREKCLKNARLTKDEQVRWQRILNEQGWMAPGWPVAYGGQNWTPGQKYIFDEEMAAAGAPSPLAFGVSMVGPVIARFGSEEQKQRFLPRILESDDWWCQGYSEPGSGSE